MWRRTMLIPRLIQSFALQDNDIYRATVRTQIRDWLDQIVARPNQEWLIVHISGGRTPGAKFYQRKGTVVEKIRADFNTGKRDR